MCGERIPCSRSITSRLLLKILDRISTKMKYIAPRRKKKKKLLGCETDGCALVKCCTSMI